MIRHVKILLTTLFVGMTLLTGSVQAASVFQNVCNGGGGSASDVCQNGQNTTNTLSGPNGVLIKASRIVATIAGTAAVIIIIISGIVYSTSGGDPTKAESAKNTLIYAVVGVIVIIISESIVSFVLSKLP